MPNQKISELQEVLAATEVDALPIVNGGSTQRISVGNLLKLPAISQKLHHGNVVASCYMDTREWRDRMSHTSWENETLCAGSWRGWLANEAAARAISGAATGDYYGSTADGKFYKLDATSGVTEVFRGSARKIPATVSVQAEAGRVVMYDPDTVGCPMWMVVDARTNVTWLDVTSASNPITSLSFRGPKLHIGKGGSSNEDYSGLCFMDFSSDALGKHLRVASVGIDGLSAANIASRHNSFRKATGNLPYIVNPYVNSIAATVLPGAPIDPATGLAVPTIYAFTNGGISRINSDSTVQNITFPLNNAANGVVLPSGDVVCDILGYSVYFYASAFPATVSGYVSTYLDANPSKGKSFYRLGVSAVVESGRSGTADARVAAIKNDFVITRASVLEGSVGATFVKNNPATPTKGMVAYITAAYPGAWQVGDSKRLWLCDATAETVTGMELVTNGTFATDTSGWSVSSTGLAVRSTACFANGGVAVTDVDGSGPVLYQQLTGLSAAKSYVVSVSFNRNGSATRASLLVGTTAGGTDLGSQVNTTDQTGSLAVSFTGAASVYVGVKNNAGDVGATGHYDNISCRLAEPDRSVKNKSLPIYGSLTKTMVGGVAMYSGFSASNYLEEAYSADWGAIGTSDFEFGMLVDGAGSGTVLSLGDGASTGSVLMRVRNGLADFFIFSSGSFGGLFYGTAIPVMVGLLEVKRSGSSVSMLFNGVVVGTTTSSLSISNSGALRIGNRQDSNDPFSSGLAYVSVSQTPSSADQSAQMWRDYSALLQTGASGTLAGSSSAVVGADYSATTGLTSIATATHVSYFSGLQRVSSEAAPASVGTITGVKASGKTVTINGTTGSYVSQPAISIRESIEGEYRRLDPAPLTQTYTATASQTEFPLPKGYTAQDQMVSAGGSIKAYGSTADYTLPSNGYYETLTFASGLTVGTKVIVWLRKA